MSNRKGGRKTFGDDISPATWASRCGTPGCRWGSARGDRQDARADCRAHALDRGHLTFEITRGYTYTVGVAGLQEAAHERG